MMFEIKKYAYVCDKCAKVEYIFSQSQKGLYPNLPPGWSFKQKFHYCKECSGSITDKQLYPNFREEF